tara:strand:+ start:7045 stop:7200 length:156 start_codon:yes stop_codon:yes gene_type:complete
MNDLKNIGDAAAGVTGFAAFFEWLPTIAAALTVIWYTARIGEWMWEKWKKQ